MFIKSVLIFYCIASMKCDEHEERRHAKILSFNANKGDFEVGLDFSLPFLRIPIKSPLDGETPYAHHDLNFPKINVNLSSLFVGGLIVLFSTVISPLLSKSFALHHWDRSSRVSDENNPLLEFSDQLLSKNQGCLQRIACMTTQHTHDMNTLRSMKQILRNNLLSSILNTTALEEASESGLKGHNCHSYGPCFLAERDFLQLITNFATLTNSVRDTNGFK